MRPTPFVFFTVPHTYWGRYSQQLMNNEYYENHLRWINEHAAKYKLNFVWVREQINHLESLVGKPVELKWWQKILEKTPFTQPLKY